MEFLFFWGHQPRKDGELSKSCFSQWWVQPFEAEGIIYLTAEHYMMAGKARLFNDHEMLASILKSKTPKGAKGLGRKVRGFEPGTWDENKYEIVLSGNKYKFSQHNKLFEFLDATGDQILVEASPYDKIWGVGMSVGNAKINDPRNWKGPNLLGFALMEVRDALR